MHVLAIVVGYIVILINLMSIFFNCFDGVLLNPGYFNWQDKTQIFVLLLQTCFFIVFLIFNAHNAIYDSNDMIQFQYQR